MNKLVIAVVAAMFSFAVNASTAEKPAAAPQAAAAAKQMTVEECGKAMNECKDEACKDKLRTENGCK